MHVHFDCFAGISGDMTLGALIDLGVPVDWLVEQIRSIPLSEFEFEATRTLRHGISAQRVKVHPSLNSQTRTWATIRELIETSPLSDVVKKRSLSIFERLAVAEAGIHHTTPEKIHFHELGGVDAIVDIVGTALCVDQLGIQSVSASAIALGRGLVKCRHGRLPVPSPATAAILKDIPVYGTDIEYELTTPTGAAIVATLAQDFGVIPEMTINKVGYGAGKRDHETIANVLRVFAGNRDIRRNRKETSGLQTESLIMIETAIDDMNPEFYGYLMERLFQDGALDVCWIPIHMKKSRPGTLVQVLCRPDKKPALANRLLGETTTLGVRSYPVQRESLHREKVEIVTSYGTVSAKRIVGLNGDIRLIPEYESCRNIAMARDLSIRTVFERLQQEMTAYLQTAGRE